MSQSQRSDGGQTEQYLSPLIRHRPHCARSPSCSVRPSARKFCVCPPGRASTRAVRPVRISAPVRCCHSRRPRPATTPAQGTLPRAASAPTWPRRGSNRGAADQTTRRAQNPHPRPLPQDDRGAGPSTIWLPSPLGRGVGGEGGLHPNKRWRAPFLPITRVPKPRSRALVRGRPCGSNRAAHRRPPYLSGFPDAAFPRPCGPAASRSAACPR